MINNVQITELIHLYLHNILYLTDSDTIKNARIGLDTNTDTRIGAALISHIRHKVSVNLHVSLHCKYQ